MLVFKIICEFAVIFPVSENMLKQPIGASGKLSNMVAINVLIEKITDFFIPLLLFIYKLKNML